MGWELESPCGDSERLEAGLVYVPVTGCGGWDPRIPPPTSRWRWSTRFPWGRSQVDADGRISCCGATLRSNGLIHLEGGCGGAVKGRGGGGGVVVSSRRSRSAMRSDCASNRPVASSAVKHQVSKPVILSSTCFIMDSKPSNFVARSAMAVVTCASNRVGFFGARSKPPRFGKKI